MEILHKNKKIIEELKKIELFLESPKASLENHELDVCEKTTVKKILNITKIVVNVEK
jgi:hypothetical protein